MIVDDEPSMRKALELALEQPGWIIDSIGSAEEALELFKEQPRDVLIVDKNLPGMSGTDFIREVRALNNEVSIIMITGYASTESAVELVRQRIDAYVEKPLESIFGIVELVRNSIKDQQIRRDRPSAVPATERPGVSSQDGERKYRAMIVSSHPHERDWVVNQLGSRFEVAHVESSRDAIYELGQASPDILIVDEAVEDPNIFVLVSMLKELDPQLICMITADQLSLKTVTKLIRLGVDSLIQKPFKPDQFDSEIEHLIRRLKLRG